MLRLVKICMMVIMPASACNAGSPSPYAGVGLAEQRVSAGLIIPLGGQRSNSSSKPRLQLSFDTRLPHNDEMDQLALNHPQRFRSSKIGFTLASNPEIYLNDRHFSAPDPRHSLSTLGWVGVGLAVTLVGGAVVLRDGLIDASD